MEKKSPYRGLNSGQKAHGEPRGSVRSAARTTRVEIVQNFKTVYDLFTTVHYYCSKTSNYVDLLDYVPVTYCPVQ